MMETYELPWEYSFPPFYTLQHHEETRKRQIIMWADIILKHHKSTKSNKLSLNTNSSILNNAALGRKLSTNLLLQVISFLKESGHLHAVDKEENEWNICWYTVNEYVDMIYSWAVETAQLNSVCTLYELASSNPELSDVNEEILLMALRKLEAAGKGEIISIDGRFGVKFF